MDGYYLLFFSIVRTQCVSLKLSYISLLASKTYCLTSSSAPLCSIVGGFKLSWSSCQNFDGTVNFVDQIFHENGLGMVPYVFLVLCMTGNV